jgi:putative DNA primase/helicase
VKFNDKQRYGGKVYQCLYSLATDDKGELCYLHQNVTGRQSESPTKGPARSARNLFRKISYLDHARSVAIRMFPVASTLGIAEGIETALSASSFTT